MKAWFNIPLWQRVIGALILGVIVGRLWGPEAASIKIVGDVFIGFIKMLVVPLIFFSLVAGVAAIGDIRKLGAVGGRALLLFVISGQMRGVVGSGPWHTAPTGRRGGYLGDPDGGSPRAERDHLQRYDPRHDPAKPGSSDGGRQCPTSDCLLPADRDRHFDGQGGPVSRFSKSSRAAAW